MQSTENEIIEFKKSTSELKEGIISIVAILNKHGHGELYFGVKNDGSIVGQTISEKTLRDLSQSIASHISPVIYPQITTELHNDKQIIVIKFTGSNAPYFAYDRAYIRTADEDRQLSPEELEKMILNKNMYLSKWDTTISNHTINEIDIKTLSEFITTIKTVGRVTVPEESPELILNKLELAKQNALTYAAWHLFCENQTVELQLAVFRGKDKTSFADFKHYKGNLFYLLEIAENYVKDKINWRVEFGNDMKRNEIPEIPIDALREAIVNAFVHRDFNSPNANEIAVYTDRIEIYNPGAFPQGLTPEDFIKGAEHSHLRNPKIAEMFFYTKNIDRWASGLQRISNECAIHNVGFKFQVLSAGFLTIFYRQTQLVKEKTTSKTTLKTASKTTLKTADKIVQIIEKNPQISIPEIAKLLGNISEEGVKYNINKLKKSGKLKRIGANKGGYWQVFQ